jgi:predicted RNase H-like HicB family nuclease
MRHVIAIVEEGTETTAFGLWFPDLPGCFSAGDTLEELVENAREAAALWLDSGGRIGRLRALSELRADPETAGDLKEHAALLVPLPVKLPVAAE